jgi:hypothetical protein
MLIVSPSDELILAAKECSLVRHIWVGYEVDF